MAGPKPSGLSGNKIDLIGPNGKIWTGPIENANALVSSGDFSFLNREQALDQGMRTQANIPTEQLKNFGQNFLSGSSFGAYDVGLRYALTPEELEYERIRREENPVGTFAGLATSSVVDPFSLVGIGVRGVGTAARLAGAEKLAANVGALGNTASALSKYTPVQALEAGAGTLGKLATATIPEGASIARTMLSNIPGRAIRGSAIGGAFAAGQSITEQSLGNMDLNGEKIFADGLQGAMLGLVFDTSIGAVGDIAVGGTKKLYGALRNSDSLQKSFSNLASKTGGADEAVLNATINAERELAEFTASKGKDPAALANLEVSMQTIFGDGSDMTQSQLGDGVKNGLSGIYKVLNNVYDMSFRPLRNKYSDAPFSAYTGFKLFDSIESSLSKGSPAARAFKQYKQDFANLRNANEIWMLKTTINSELEAAAAKGFYKDTALLREMGIISDAMNSAADDSLIKAARATGDKAEIELAENAIKSKANEFEDFKKDKNKLKKLSASLKMREPKSFRQFFEKLSQMDGQTLVDNLFRTRNNVEGLRFLKKNYEPQFDLLAAAFRSKIANQATRNGQFNPVKALDLLSERNLSRETLEMVFGSDAAGKIEKAREAFIKQKLTAEEYTKRTAYNKVLTQSESDNTFLGTGSVLGTVIGGVPGAGVGAAIGGALDILTDKNRLAKAFLGFEKAFKAFDDKVGKKAGEIFENSVITSREAARTATIGTIQSGKEEKKDSKKIDPRELKHEDMIMNLSQWSENPDKLVEHLTNELGEMNELAPGIAQATTAASFRAINLLGEKLPVMPPKKPLDTTDYKVSNAEAFKFGRYYNTVVNPTGVLDHVNDGTLNNDHIETLIRVYPEIYKSMQEILMMEMIRYNDKKEKKPLPAWKKISLSLFLQNNLSESLEQKNIGANFNNWLNPNVASGQQAMPSKGNKSKRDELANSYKTDTQRVESEV